MSQNLAGVVEALLSSLDEIGFNDPDGEVNGGDCVDVINQHVDGIRAALRSRKPARAGSRALSWRAGGNANEYTLLQGDHWLAAVRMNGELWAHRQEEYLALFAAAPALLDALKATVVPLIRLGDFVGNVDAGGASGFGSFDRCAIVHQVRTAIADASVKECQHD